MYLYMSSYRSWIQHRNQRSENSLSQDFLNGIEEFFSLPSVIVGKWIKELDVHVVIIVIIL